MVSMLATVAELVKLPKVSVSLPPARSMDTPATAEPRMMVSLPVPPMMVSMLATVAEFVPLARVSVSLPAPRSTEALVTAAAEGDRCRCPGRR